VVVRIWLPQRREPPATRIAQTRNTLRQFRIEPNYLTRSSADCQSSQLVFIDGLPDTCNGSVPCLAVSYVKALFSELAYNSEVGHARIHGTRQQVGGFQDRHVSVRQYSAHATIFSSIRCSSTTSLRIAIT
jgi:hypothetical protein